MADTLYVNVDGTPEQLDIAGSGTSPEYIERIEAVEAKTNPATETNMGIVYLTDSADSSKDAASHYAASPKALAELDKSAIKTVNGNAPDSDGNITPAQTGCLPLSGGTMTGDILWDSGTIYKNQSGGYDALILSGGTASKSGAEFIALNNYSAVQAGDFVCRANDGSIIRDLVGSANGNLVWDGKHIERVNAIVSNYIRYESGLQICWGITKHETYTTFPVAFISSPSVVVSHVMGTTEGSATVTGVLICDNTKIYYKDSKSENAGRYIAIGYWK